MNIEEKKHKATQLNALIDDIIKERIHIPNNALVFLSIEDLFKVFTRKRLELLHLIEVHHPSSIQDLVDITGRTKQAIGRDLKILEEQEILTLEKQGRVSKPKVLRKTFLFSCTGETSLSTHT